MAKRLWLLGVAALLVLAAGCKKDEATPPSFEDAYKRLQQADKPADFEWPLGQMSELATESDRSDIRLAARFELARGWLRLGILTGVPVDTAEASRVLAATGMQNPQDIVSRFEAVAAASDVGGTPLPTWAVEGAALAKALAGTEGTEAERLSTVTRTALGSGAFSPEAAAVIFSHMVRLAPSEAEIPPDRKRRQLYNVVRYACPVAMAELPAEGDITAERRVAFAAACKTAPWLSAADIPTLANGAPCAATGTVVGADEAHQVLAAFFNLLLTAYQRPGPSGQPTVFYRRFPVEGGCQVLTELMGRLGS